MNTIFEALASRTAAEAWLFGMLPLLFKSVVILGAAGIMARLLKGSAAALRHLVWLTAIAGILFLPAMTRVLPSIHLPVQQVVGATIGETSVLSEPPAVGRGSSAANPASGRAPTGFGARDTRTSAGSFARATSSPVTGGLSVVVANLKIVPWTVWLFVLWIGGTALLLARLLFAHLSAFHLVRRSTIVHDDDWNLRLERHAGRLAIHRRIRLRESDWLDVPVTVGSIRPTVLLPTEASEWDDDTRDAVLLHELAHIRRLDCLAQTVVESVRAFLWINPLTWLAESAMRVERERACDDLVITSGTRASTYAKTLLELAGSLRGRDYSSAAVMAMARRSDLEGRLLDILDDGPRLRNVNRLGALLAILVVCSFVFPIAALSTTPQNTPENVVKYPDRRLAVGIPPIAPVAPQAPAVDFDFHFDFDQFGQGDLADNLGAHLGASLNAQLTQALQDVVNLEGSEAFLDDVLRDVEDAMNDIEFKLSGMTGDYEPSISSTDTLTIDQLIQLARHGVDADYIDDLRAAGYEDLSFETLMSFARHGIDANFVTELAVEGFSPVPADDLVAFARYGVDASLVRALRQSGLPLTSADEIIGLARHGVDEDDIAGYGELGFKDLSVDDLIDLSRHGVDPHEMQMYMNLGFANLKIGDYIDLARNGVDEDLVSSLASAGYADLPVGSILDLSRQGVDEDLISGLRRQGYESLSVDEILDVARHGLEPECIEALNSAGYGRFSLESLIRFSRYGVDADFLTELVDAGVTDLDADELIELRKHDISADYIKRVRNDR